MNRPLEFLLAGLAQLLAVVALAVRLEGGGRVLYRDTRLGRDGQPFRVVKFRIRRGSAGTGGRVVADNDPRLTRLGRMLRRFHLDELCRNCSAC